MWGIQVNVWNADKQCREWQWVHPGDKNATPYRYETQQEAQRMAKLCYQSTDPEFVRVQPFDGEKSHEN